MSRNPALGIFQSGNNSTGNNDKSAGQFTLLMKIALVGCLEGRLAFLKTFNPKIEESDVKLTPAGIQSVFVYFGAFEPFRDEGDHLVTRIRIEFVSITPVRKQFDHFKAQLLKKIDAVICVSNDSKACKGDSDVMSYEDQYQSIKMSACLPNGQRVPAKEIRGSCEASSIIHFAQEVVAAKAAIYQELNAIRCSLL